MTGAGLVHPAVVVDASVWVGNFVPADRFGAPSVQWLDGYAQAGGVIFAPDLLLIEVAAAVARRTGLPAEGKTAATDLTAARYLKLVPLDEPLRDAAVALAADLRLRAADAVYVTLAARLGLPLVTWDQEQAVQAAARVTVFAPSTFPA